MALVVWLIIAYVVLTRPNVRLVVGIPVLVFTLVFLLAVTVISFRPSTPVGSKPPANVSSKLLSNPGQDIEVVRLMYVHTLVKLSENPEMQKILKEEFPETE